MLLPAPKTSPSSSSHVSLLQWTIRQLKSAACELLQVPEAEFDLWDYFQNDKYKCLEESLTLSVETAKVLDGQAILLEHKKVNRWSRCSC